MSIEEPALYMSRFLFPFFFFAKLYTSKAEVISHIVMLSLASCDRFFVVVVGIR